MLGKQAEACFKYYLDHSNRYSLLASNIQIQGKTETLGELDYLVFDKLKKVNIHIELACKFYLYDPSIKGAIEKKWIGPNRKDTLIEKMDKLRTKQYPLLFKSETETKLKTLNVDVDSVKQQLCMKNYLFTEKGFIQNELPIDYQSCVRGYWIRFSEFTSEDNEALYLIPSKKQWLIPPEDLNNWQNFSEAQAVIKLSITNKRAPLVYKKTAVTLERFFVVWW